jgi:hypothetical protein
MGNMRSARNVFQVSVEADLVFATSPSGTASPGQLIDGELGKRRLGEASLSVNIFNN